MKTVLHVEDSAEDAFLFGWAFREANLSARLVHVRDGSEAINYLEGAGPYSDRQLYPIPDLVLLDIKMPKLNGFDVLKWARENEVYRHLPIFILSSSHLEQDVARAKALGADRYFTKSVRFRDVVEALQPTISHSD